MEIVEVDAVDLMKSVGMKVRVIRVKEAVIRSWIANKLLLLAGHIATITIEIESTENGAS